MTREELIHKIENGEHFKYLFFWGHQPSKSGEITSSCFSQWWLSSFVIDEIEYKSAEHYMMAEKARLFNDDEILNQIIKCETPAEAKKLGRKVKNFDPQKWDENKFSIVCKGNLHKFEQHEDLKDYLITTGDRVIVEASPVDPVWGIGLAKDHHDAGIPMNWKGENLLGFALMEIREELR